MNAGGVSSGSLRSESARWSSGRWGWFDEAPLDLRTHHRSPGRQRSSMDPKQRGVLDPIPPRRLVGGSRRITIPRIRGMVVRRALVGGKAYYSTSNPRDCSTPSRGKAYYSTLNLVSCSTPSPGRRGFRCGARGSAGAPSNPPCTPSRLVALRSVALRRSKLRCVLG